MNHYLRTVPTTKLGVTTHFSKIKLFTDIIHELSYKAMYGVLSQIEA